MKNLEINFCIIFSIRGHQWGEGRELDSQGATHKESIRSRLLINASENKTAEAWSDGGHDRMYRGSNQVFHREKS